MYLFVLWLPRASTHVSRIFSSFDSKYSVSLIYEKKKHIWGCLWCSVYVIVCLFLLVTTSPVLPIWALTSMTIKILTKLNMSTCGLYNQSWCVITCQEWMMGKVGIFYNNISSESQLKWNSNPESKILSLLHSLIPHYLAVYSQLLLEKNKQSSRMIYIDIFFNL